MTSFFFFFHHLIFFIILTLFFEVMPKCADVQLQLGSDNLLKDIKDVAFFRKLQRLGLYTCGKAHDNAMKHVHLPSWSDRWRHTSEGTCIQSSMFESRWTPLPKLGGERFLLGQSSAFWCCVWISVVWAGVGRFTRSCRCDFFFSQFGTCITGCGTTFELECWQPKGNGSFFLRTTLVMHASVLGTRTRISIQRRLGSALGCPVLVHLSAFWSP